MHVEHLLFRLLNQSAASAAIALLRCLTKRPKTHSVAPPLRILIRCATNDTLNPNTQVAPPLRILIRADRARNCFTDPAAYDTILEALPDCPRGTLLPIHQYDIDGDGGNPNGGLLSSGGGSGAFAANGHSAAAPQIGYGGGGGFAANRQPAMVPQTGGGGRGGFAANGYHAAMAQPGGRCGGRGGRLPFVSNGWAPRPAKQPPLRGSASLQPGGDARWAAQSQLRGSRPMPPQLPQDPRRRQ